MNFLRAPGARTTARVATAALLIAIAASAAEAQRVRLGSREGRARLDTTFAFDKNGTVTVNVPNGEIVINGGSGNQLHVRGRDDEDVRLDVSSTRVMVETRSHGDGVELTVPQGVHVIATSRSGDVKIMGTHGAVEVHATNGDIEIDDVVGRLDIGSLSGDITVGNVVGDADIETTSGDVKLSNIRGNIGASTVSGDIGLRGVTSKDVRAKTTSGDVTFDGLIDPAGRYELSSNSGDVRLHIQRDASAQVTVSTWNGGIDSEFPITLRPGEHPIGTGTSKRFIFVIGDGGARITAESFSGDITISANGHGASTRP
ncbi:MAG TPA: DUF4097 family beta strand repeat-containing protein [Gemmatimonadaceae bacterium]|nr:DUF4097 family beta strand repeat-containing protein [Gemmatimonadaceae bacterium]